MCLKYGNNCSGYNTGIINHALLRSNRNYKSVNKIQKINDTNKFRQRIPRQRVLVTINNKSRLLHCNDSEKAVDYNDIWYYRSEDDRFNAVKNPRWYIYDTGYQRPI